MIFAFVILLEYFLCIFIKENIISVQISRNTQYNYSEFFYMQTNELLISIFCSLKYALHLIIEYQPINYHRLTRLSLFKRFARPSLHAKFAYVLFLQFARQFSLLEDELSAGRDIVCLTSSKLLEVSYLAFRSSLIAFIFLIDEYFHLFALSCFYSFFNLQGKTFVLL